MHTESHGPWGYSSTTGTVALKICRTNSTFLPLTIAFFGKSPRELKSLRTKGRKGRAGRGLNPADRSPSCCMEDGGVEDDVRKMMLAPDGPYLEWIGQPGLFD
ncbi:hypothetical protein SADUNF_Sadunf04G0148500 [Salix dunnii]|uniref:Uncharacterized protein n=1 Tax=Salix dunnii TaxID=1413687 RepID=A0A835MZM4_9ROSI|nr:hypothetical protein SADUNF_Sadunf04G0148500 [Salix dunnii]